MFSLVFLTLLCFLLLLRFSSLPHFSAVSSSLHCLLAFCLKCRVLWRVTVCFLSTARLKEETLWFYSLQRFCAHLAIERKSRYVLLSKGLFTDWEVKPYIPTHLLTPGRKISLTRAFFHLDRFFHWNKWIAFWIMCCYYVLDHVLSTHQECPIRGSVLSGM